MFTQGGDEPRVDHLGDHEKRFAAQTVDPIIGGAAQTQALPGDVATGQGGEFPMIKPYVAIDVKQPHCSRLLGVVRVADALNPFFG